MTDLPILGSAQDLAMQNKCPQGHLLPHESDFGQCTPVYCADPKSVGKKRGPKPPTKKELEPYLGQPAKTYTALAHKLDPKLRKEIEVGADEIIDGMIPPSVVGFAEVRALARAEKGESVKQLAQAAGRFAAARSFFHVPPNMDAAQSEQWVQERADLLTVDALVEIERQLKFGDNKQRLEAARDVLDMVGKRKREASFGTANTIHLHFDGVAKGGPPPVPWRQKVAEEAEAVLVELEEKKEKA